MIIAIPIKYEKGYYESHFKLPDGSVCIMEDLSYIYSDGKRFLCITRFGHYGSDKTKYITVYNEDLSLADMGRQFFVMVETE